MIFRVWDSLNNRYTNQNEDFMLDMEGRLLTSYYGEHEWVRDKDRYTVEWGPGNLKCRKSGVDLYTGDIVNIGGQVGRIEFDDIENKFSQFVSKEDFNHYYPLGAPSCRYEKIGNMHDE